MKLFIHPGKEGDLFFKTFLWFSLPCRSLKDFRVLRQERELCLRMGQHIFWTKSGQAALTICLTFFLYCVRSLYSLYSILKNHQGGLIVTSVKSLVRSDRKIFTADRSDSECRRSRWLPPRLLRPFLVLPSLVQTDQTPFLTFYQTQVLALACLVIHHSMGLLCLSQCLICRPQHSGFFIFAFHWSHGEEIENIKMHSFFFPLFFRCDSHSLPPV